MNTATLPLLNGAATFVVPPFKQQLLKWVGNKQRFAHQIASLLPADMVVYHEPFLGSGAILGTLAPTRAFASDILRPLAEIWMQLADDPDTVKGWYADRRSNLDTDNKTEIYDMVRRNYNLGPNGADLLFLSRA